MISKTKRNEIHVCGENENTGLYLNPAGGTTAEGDPIVILTCIGNYRKAGGPFRLSQLKEAITEVERMLAERQKTKKES